MLPKGAVQVHCFVEAPDQVSPAAKMFRWLPQLLAVILLCAETKEEESVSPCIGCDCAGS